MARTKNDDRDAPRRRILEAAEAVLRRHGPAKITVSDVARAIGLSHASVYRHFASKADLIDALLAGWLETVARPLRAIAEGEGPAGDRLRAWLLQLHREKLRKVTADPEHFAAYHAIAEESRAVVDRHIEALLGQIGAIVASGVGSGEFRVADPRRAAVAVLNGSMRFHHPAMLAGTSPPPTEADASAVIDLLIAGLRAGVL